eukprot:jgi/Undpi1/234/HiC_scaffold_1.g00231.m1
MPRMERGGGLSAQERGENAAAQEEELEALEAIYGEGCEVLSRGSTASCPELRIRVSDIPLVSLHLHLPVGYPSRELPVVEIRAPGLGQAARNKLVEGGTGGGGGSDGGPSKGWKTDGTTMAEGRHGAEGGGGARRTPPAGERGVEEEVLAEQFVDIFHGEAFTDRKSTFQAHLARVYSERQVNWVRCRLLENSKIARATHNVAAWRVWDEARGVQLHDNDDDGESAAGSRLAHMLAITRAQNVLVVVSRWFGGIHLGPDRFKHINNAARELLVKCGGTIPIDNGGASDKVNTGREGGGKQKGRRKRG